MDGSARPVGFRTSVRETAEMIKLSHSVFALPFALLSGFRAAGGMIPWRPLAAILVAMVSARTAAMAFNRLLDRRIDAANPRTASRALPAGRLSPRFAAAVCAIASIVFVASAAALNRLALVLSLPTLFLLLFYSATKRFTSLSHAILGLCLGIAPAGAWIAIRGHLELPPVWLGLAVLFWTAGFDVIYSLQDQEFDRRTGLHSLPARWGAGPALAFSGFFHAAAVGFFILFGRAVAGGALLWVGIAVAAAGLAWQHAIIGPGDLSRVDAAFFTANGVVSLAVGLLGVADLWIG